MQSLSNDTTATASNAVNSLAFVLFLLLIVAAPLSYGGVLPGGTFLIQSMAFVTAALAFASRAAESRLGAAWIAAIALALIAGLGLVQLAPMQPSLLQSISPASAKIYAGANSILHLFGRPATAARISIAPTGTESTALLVLAFAAIFCAGAIVASTRRRRQIVIAVLLGATMVHVLVASIMQAGTDRMHGLFVNPDHFAGYLQIALAFAFGLIWQETMMSGERVAHIRDRAERLERRAVPFIWRILVWGVIAAGIALTRSRGGVAAASLALLFMIAVALLRRPMPSQRRRIAAFVLLAILGGMAFVALSTGQAAVMRFLASDPRDLRTDTRIEIWRGSVEAWRMFPTFGSGLGTFREAYRRVQPADIQGLVEQAHDDFLQLLVTGGWVGAALGAIAFGTMFVLLFRALGRQPHRAEAAMLLSALGALFSLTVHGIVEFNMSIPAIPATLAAMVGAAWAGRE